MYVHAGCAEKWLGLNLAYLTAYNCYGHLMFASQQPSDFLALQRNGYDYHFKLTM